MMDNEKEENPKLNRSNQIKVISQGAYGCIVSPNIDCNGKIGSRKYVTKIQRKAETSKREVEISAIVRTIPHFEQYFAPVLENCSISLGKIDPNEIKKCKFITNVNDKYESNRIAYVGDLTIADYLLKIFAQHPKDFFKVFINSYREIMYGFELLETKNIIHFDIKENNIMIKHSNKQASTDFTPVIIDFGLSYDYSKLSMENPKTYEEFFYVYGDDYGPWCIEIAVISYFINEVKNWENVNATSEQLKTAVNNFLTKNPFYIDLKSNDPARFSDYAAKITTYFDNMRDKSCKQIIEELCKKMSTWDNYALAILYFYLVETLHMNRYSQENSLLKTYTEFLYSIILAIPNERKPTTTIKVEIEKLFEITDRNMNNEYKKKIHQLSKDPTNIVELKRKLAEHRLNTKLHVRR